MSYMSKKVDEGNTLYFPINKEKFVGKEGRAVCRSSWERLICQWADHNSSVLQWSSELFSIPYMDKTKRDYKGMPKKRQYFPDFVMKIKNAQGEIDVWIVEVKPYKETILPKFSKGKSQTTILRENQTWAVNQAKWMAAEAYCNQRGWKFKILTEKQILR